MLARRLFAATIIISILLGLVFFDYFLGKDDLLGRPGVVLALFGIVAAAMAAGEMAHMFAHVNWHSQWTPIIGTVAMVAVSSAPMFWQDYPENCPMGTFGWITSGVTLAIVISFFAEMWHFRTSDETENDSHGEIISRLGHSVLIYGYLIMFFGFVFAHRMFESQNGLGLIVVVLLITTVKMSDAFAYFVGKTFGKTPIAPRLSPKKTLEGSIGGFVGGLIGATLILHVIAPGFSIVIDKPWWWVFLYAILVTLAGMVGDLAESLLKRDANCKDSSSWLPGLGGVLDIIDSLIFAAPISFLLLI